MTLLDPLYMQGKPIQARRERQWMGDVLKPGVDAAGSLQPTGNVGLRQVSVAAGLAYIDGQLSSDQGLYQVWNETAQTMTHAQATSGRLDQIIVRVEDTAENAGVGPLQGTIAIVQGTTDSGAVTLTNRTGAVADASIPKSWLRIADVLVPAGNVNIPIGNVRDRRYYARGYQRNDQSVAGDVTIGVTNTYIEITPGGSSILQRRIEFPPSSPLTTHLRWELRCTVYNGSASTATVVFAPWLDGTALWGGQAPYARTFPAGFAGHCHIVYDYGLPLGGSHTFSWGVKSTQTGVVIRANANSPIQTGIQEIWKPSVTQ